MHSTRLTVTFFEELPDLDGDGRSGAGELQTLAEAGIAELSLASHTMDEEGAEPGTGRDTPQGNRLLAQSTFTRADGTVGDVYEAAFATDETDTLFRGERGRADWLAHEPIVTAKGFGTMVRGRPEVGRRHAGRPRRGTVARLPQSPPSCSRSRLAA